MGWGAHLYLHTLYVGLELLLASICMGACSLHAAAKSRFSLCVDVSTPLICLLCLLCRIKEESEVIEGEVVEIEIDRPATGQVAKTVRGGGGGDRSGRGLGEGAGLGLGATLVMLPPLLHPSLPPSPSN